LYFIYIFWKTRGGSSFDVSLNPEIVNYGQTYNLNDVIDKDYKQVDFIKGVSHAFNLKMTTDQTTKTINIEPFNTFYQPYGSAIDWTYKLDRSREVNDKFLKSDLKQKFIFKHGIKYKLPDGKILIACYHPSPRNVNTKVIDKKKMISLLSTAKKHSKA